MSEPLSVEGDKEVRDNLRKLARQYPDAFAGALYKLGVAILSDSLPRVPVEFGALRASGYVAPPQGRAQDATVEVGFGTVYAVPQHERLDYKHPRGGEAKYLEKAVRAIEPDALRLMTKWTQQLAESGGRWSVDPTAPTRPRITNSNRKSKSQAGRLRRAARNVRRRTGR